MPDQRHGAPNYIPHREEQHDEHTDLRPMAAPGSGGARPGLRDGAGKKRLTMGGGWVAGLALPILLAHQTEEWVKPGGFLPFANERLLKSDRPTWPLTERIGFHVNVTVGWGAAIAGGPRHPGAATPTPADDTCQPMLPHPSRTHRTARRPKTADTTPAPACSKNGSTSFSTPLNNRLAKSSVATTARTQGSSSGRCWQPRDRVGCLAFQAPSDKYLFERIRRGHEPAAHFQGGQTPDRDEQQLKAGVRTATTSTATTAAAAKPITTGA